MSPSMSSPGETCDPGLDLPENNFLTSGETTQSSYPENLTRRSSRQSRSHLENFHHFNQLSYSCVNHLLAMQS